MDALERAVAQATSRTCEGCGAWMPAYIPRKRGDDGKLLCEGCQNGRPGRPKTEGAKVAYFGVENPFEDGPVVFAGENWSGPAETLVGRLRAAGIEPTIHEWADEWGGFRIVVNERERALEIWQDGINNGWHTTSKLAWSTLDELDEAIPGWCPYCEKETVWTHDPLEYPAPSIPLIEDHWVCKEFHEASRAEVEHWSKTKPRYASLNDEDQWERAIEAMAETVAGSVQTESELAEELEYQIRSASAYDWAADDVKQEILQRAKEKVRSGYHASRRHAQHCYKIPVALAWKLKAYDATGGMANDDHSAEERWQHALDSVKGGDTDPIVIGMIEGEIKIQDGNHRAAAAHAIDPDGHLHATMSPDIAKALLGLDVMMVEAHLEIGHRDGPFWSDMEAKEVMERREGVWEMTYDPPAEYWITRIARELEETMSDRYRVRSGLRPVARIAGRVVAHDSGDGETIYHCPFCGGGQVVGRSDGTVECGYCKANFTVQVQPQRPGTPQTIDGQPYDIPEMPGVPGEPAPEVPVPGAVPPEVAEVPVEEEPPFPPPAEEKKEPPPFAKGSDRRLSGGEYKGHEWTASEDRRGVAWMVYHGMSVTPDAEGVASSYEQAEVEAKSAIDAILGVGVTSSRGLDAYIDRLAAEL
jgi:hypothetical protein